MRSLEIRLGSTESHIENYEIVHERKKDDKWEQLDPPVELGSGAAPIIKLMEDDERIVITAKVTKKKMVYDRDQNAHMVVETQEEKDKKDKEYNDRMKSHPEVKARLAEEEKEKKEAAEREAKIKAADDRVARAEADKNKSAPPAPSRLAEFGMSSKDVKNEAPARPSQPTPGPTVGRTSTPTPTSPLGGTPPKPGSRG